MQKIILCLFIFAVIANINLFAYTDNQSKLSFQSKIMLEQYKFAKKILPTLNSINIDESQHPYLKSINEFIRWTAQDGVEYTKCYIMVDSRYSISEIEKLGGTELVKTKTIALISIPISKVENLENINFISKIELAIPLKLTLDKALPATNVDKVHSGEGLRTNYTGKGVLVGVGDTGFDFTHPMFSDISGVPRIKRATILKQQGGLNIYNDSNEIKNTVRYSTRQEFHATHVLGIAAGTPVTGNHAVYSGCATEADIVVCDITQASDYDNTLLEMTNNFFKYADSVGKPISINYSLGVGNNAHAGDGESMFDRSMSELLQANEKGKIVCVSAGNEGGVASHFMCELSSESDSAFASSCLEYGYIMGMVPGYLTSLSFWGEVDKDFAVNFFIKDGATNEIKQLVELSTLSPQSIIMKNINVTFGTKTRQFYVNLIAQPANFEYNKPIIYIDVQDLQNSQSHKFDTLFYTIKSLSSNATIHCWNNALEEFYNYSANIKPDDNYIIASPGSVEEVITVGAYVTKNYGPYINYVYQSSGVLPDANGDIAYFSSKGPLSNGKMKPDITAPGADIYSAYNRYYQSNDYYQFMVDTIASPYSIIAVSGTSMSSPMVTGIVALMLQIKPDLTQTEVKELLKITAINDEWTGDARINKSPIWGWGKIDAYALLQRLEETSIKQYKNIVTNIFPNPATNFVNVFFNNPADGNINIEILNSLGQVILTPVNSYYSQGIHTLEIKDINLQSGAYYLKISTPKGVYLDNFIVK
jgi:subtilisin family serine protease